MLHMLHSKYEITNVKLGLQRDQGTIGVGHRDLQISVQNR